MDEDIEKIKFYTVDATDLDKAVKDLEKNKMMRSKNFKDQNTKILNSRERSWLKKQGKNHLIDFDDSMRNELRKYFISMDGAGSRYIGVEELLDPLIALGLAENRTQVQALFDLVDTSKSGKIEFEDFLNILRIGEGNSPMVERFREMARGRLVEDANVLPFNLVVSSYRRKMLMNAMMSDDPTVKGEGEKIYKAYSKLLESKQLSKKK